MAITAQEVNKLRKSTGAGMMDCKKALTEAEGDFDKAIEYLRKKGQKVSASRADRSTSEGVIFTKTNENATEATLIAFTCETDFVSKNQDFISLGSSIIQIAFEQKPSSIEELYGLVLDNMTVKERIIDLTGKIGEKLEVKSYEVLRGEQVITYVHSNSKLGVLVALKNLNGTDPFEVGKNVAMQIASMNPIAIDEDGVDASIVEKEIEIGKEQARQEGKPEAILEKIARGKLNKFYKENTLLAQTFVKDNSKNISQYLSSVSKGLTVSDYKRITIG